MPARNRKPRRGKVSRNEQRYGVTKMPFARKKRIPRPKTKRQRGLTRIQLLANIPEVVTRTQEHVTFTSKKKVRMRKSKRIKILTKTLTSVPGEATRRHEQEILILQPGELDPFRKGTKLRVSCSCEWHMYVNEVILNKYGAAPIRYSNGAYPKFTNPSGVPMVCLAGDSLVRTDEGMLSIKDVTIDHKVETLTGDMQQVLESAQTGVRPIRDIVLDSGKCLKATDNHPILVWDDWLTFRETDNLHEGDLVVTRNHTDDVILDEVKRVHKNRGSVPVYDIEVDNEHNFVANDLVVSNCKHLHVLLTRRKL